MATCPHCRGHLTDTHRCPRRPRRVLLELVASALAGGVAALLLVALIDPKNELAHLDRVAGVGGLFAGAGLDWLVRRSR